MKSVQRRFFVKHSKSSAAMVALVLHALLAVSALSFVVLRQVIREPPVFVGHEFSKPQPLPRLQPPSSARKPPAAKPRFERIPVEVQYEPQQPDISLPELAGAKSAFGGDAGTAVESLGTIGFAMPELGLFNLKSRGEKIFLILDAGPHMLEDKMGGIPAYTVIKQELLRIADELPATAVFNICVFSRGKSITLFPNLVKASDSNVRKAAAWLLPLNGVDESIHSGRYGLQTIGPGGTEQRQDLRTGRFAAQGSDEAHQYRQELWFRPAMLAMQQGADAVFLLTNAWGHQRVVSKDRNLSLEEWHQTAAGKRWLKHAAMAKEKLDEENRRRNAAGEPPRVIAHGRWGLMRTYYPDVQGPPLAQYYHFTPDDFQDAFEQVRAAYRTASAPRGLKKKDPFTFNVVQFVPADSDRGSDARFYELTKKSRGGFQTIAGLEALKSYVTSGPE